MAGRSDEGLAPVVTMKEWCEPCEGRGKELDRYGDERLRDGKTLPCHPCGGRGWVLRHVREAI